ncbi:helix-turn-helix transcriptional regulator [Millisia brevis]|uniref:helix-turn-helix transcriptional regulator n=1 Tax=Millisia brevis TaxID=264148 RepID=UPI0008352AD5|nr:AraC family transcriptional regulator [Millisia brevis]
MTEFWHGEDIPELEARRSCRENTCYRPHTHDRVSIGFIDSGASTFRGPGDAAVRLLPGDVVVIPAGHVHACNPDHGQWRYRMIHAVNDWMSEVAAPASRGVLDRVGVFRTPETAALFAEATDLLFTGATRAQVETALGRVLEACAGAASILAEPERPPLPAALGPVLDRLRNDPANPPLDDLARLAGMSKYQLIRTMKRSTGLSPLAWRHNQRVGRARTMLRAGYSVVDTAHALGFVDQSHFHRVFRAHVAAAPGAYRT